MTSGSAAISSRWNPGRTAQVATACSGGVGGTRGSSSALTRGSAPNAGPPSNEKTRARERWVCILDFRFRISDESDREELVPSEILNLKSKTQSFDRLTSYSLSLPRQDAEQPVRAGQAAQITGALPSQRLRMKISVTHDHARWPPGLARAGFVRQ